MKVPQGGGDEILPEYKIRNERERKLKCIVCVQNTQVKNSSVV